MRTIEVKQGQTFFDVVIETTGDVTKAFEIANLNNISVTDNLSIGQKIELPVNSVNKTIVFPQGHYPASKTFETTTETDIDYLLPQTLPHI